MRNLTGESQRWTGLKIRAVWVVSAAGNFHLSGVSNRVVDTPRASALPAAPTSCRLGLHTCLSAASYSGPAETHPTSSLSRVEMKLPTPTSRLILHSLIRAGSVPDSDLGVLACLARAPGHGFDSVLCQKLGFQAVCLDQNSGTP